MGIFKFTPVEIKINKNVNKSIDGCSNNCYNEYEVVKNTTRKETMNTEKLKSLIKERGVSKKHIYQALGLTYNAFERRLENKVPFTINEANTICDVLHITSSKEKIDLFFSVK